MNGYEMLVREHDALKEEVKELKAQLDLLLKEREATKEAERLALEHDMREYKKNRARLLAFDSEGCRNEH